MLLVAVVAVELIQQWQARSSYHAVRKKMTVHTRTPIILGIALRGPLTERAHTRECDSQCQGQDSGLSAQAVICMHTPRVDYDDDVVMILRI